MDVRENWAVAIAELRRAPDAHSCRAFGDLYRLALADGDRVLARQFPGMDAAARADVVADVLVAKLSAFIAPATRDPRIVFITALVRRVRDGFRRTTVRTRGAQTLAAMDQIRQSVATNEDDRLQDIDTTRALLTLSPRDQSIVLGDGWGIDREEIARLFGTTRENVDQIVSRFRKRLQRGGP